MSRASGAYLKQFQWCCRTIARTMRASSFIVTDSMPVSTIACATVRPTPRVSFRSDLVVKENTVGMSLCDIANRSQPSMKFLRLVLGQAERRVSIDSKVARNALLGVFNLNSDTPFLAREDAERVEQHIADDARPDLESYQVRYRFLRHVLTRACRSVNPLRELDLLKATHAALEDGRRISSSDAGDALLCILLMNDGLDFLSAREAGRVELGLRHAYARVRGSEQDHQFLYDMTVLALEGRRAQSPSA
ncbi:hypothetical protein WG628_21190 [Stenotrophomonas maltophilia]